MEQALSLRLLFFTAVVLIAVQSPVAPAVVTEPAPAIVVEFPYAQMPRQFWARELVWLHNLGLGAIEASPAPASSPETPADLLELAGRAGVKVISRVVDPVRISALSPEALLRSWQALLDRKQLIWTDVETEVTPQFRSGAVSLSGDEQPALQVLRRELNIENYWGNVLRLGDTIASGKGLPEHVSQFQASTPEASAVSITNSGKTPWHGELRAYIPSIKRDLVVPDVSVPARNALLLPIDVSFASPVFCRDCSGMSNSERLLYATAELTAMEFENGILSFEFYAPSSGFAILQLERQPLGPMLAGGHLIPFDWDAENKRARLPIPAGKAPGYRIRIAITMTGPDDVASFIDTHILVIGQTNHILTDYSSEGFAKRSRLIVPAGWKSVAEVKSPTQIAYAIDVPANRLHGDHADLRLEADGVGMSHVRVQLLRPVSVHVAEASALHFGTVSALVSDPVVIPVESPSGRNLTLQIRNNAPEIRVLQIELSGDQVDFSPSKAELTVGASMERELSVRVFDANAAPGLHAATVTITGPAILGETKLLFPVFPRGGSIHYEADLNGTGKPQSVWENARLRAVFSEPDGGRWMEFFFKESGKSFLPVAGVPLANPVKVSLHDNELTISGTNGLPSGAKSGNVEWKAETVGSVTTYRVTDTTGKAPTEKN